MSVIIRKHKGFAVWILLVALVLVGIYTSSVLSVDHTTTPILNITNSCLTTYLADASLGQGVSPTAGQRGVNLDGTVRGPAAIPLAMGANSFERSQCTEVSLSNLRRDRQMDVPCVLFLTVFLTAEPFDKRVVSKTAGDRG